MLKIGVIADVEEELQGDFGAKFADAVFVGSARQTTQFSVNLVDLHGWSNPPQGDAQPLPDRLYFPDLWVALLPSDAFATWLKWKALWSQRRGRVLVVVLGPSLGEFGQLGADTATLLLPSASPTAASLTDDQLVHIVEEGRRLLPDAFHRMRPIADAGVVTRATIHNLTAFEGVGLDFVPGLNVFIGSNSTGKTHTLKLIYSILSAGRRLARRSNGRKQERLGELESEVKGRIAGLFRMSDGQSARLVRDGREGHVTIEHQHQLTTATFDDVGVDLASEVIPNAPRLLFIPSREALALFEGFIAAYENRELSFDETYHDLCVALDAKPLRGSASKDVDDLLGDLGQVLGGDLEVREGRFVLVQHGTGRVVEAHMMAEGLRKLASIVRLVRNGSLGKHCILFWDEPESSLNPKLAEKVLQFLLRLAQHGVQIFLATHDYLIAHKLSLAAERATHPDVRFRFFSFWRDEAAGSDAPAQVEHGDTLVQIDHDPILDEYLSFAAREVELAAGARSEVEPP